MFHVMYHISCGSDVDTKVKLRALLTDSHIYIYVYIYLTSPYLPFPFFATRFFSHSPFKPFPGYIQT